MSRNLCDTLQGLADLTWRRMEAAAHLGLAWGEETNTEMVLLAMQERHRQHVRVRAFNRRQEAKNGSDWEWWIGSPGRWFGMRVQAKRISQTTGRFHRIHTQRARRQPKTQMDTLIEQARADRLTPAYCFYVQSDNPPRSVLLPSQWQNLNGLFVGGCLIAHASAVKNTGSEALAKIAEVAFPWHHLVCECAAAKRNGHAHRAELLLRNSLNGAAVHAEDGDIEDDIIPSVRLYLPEYLQDIATADAVIYGSELESQAAGRAIERGLAGFVIVNTSSSEDIWVSS